MEFSLFLLAPMAGLAALAGLLGYMIGRDRAVKTVHSPTDKAAASALFGNDASLWTMSNNGWKIGPVKEQTAVRVPRWYDEVLTFYSGRTYISGAMECDSTKHLQVGDSLELIPPVGYR